MPEIDRALKGPRNDFGSRPLATIVASAIVINLLTAMLITLAPYVGNALEPDTPTYISHTSHGTIFIDGNAQFNHTDFPDNGVSSGNGTASNPYIIEGWNISALSEDGIRIWNTDAHFEIRDCEIHDTLIDYTAIFLSNCTNGSLSGNKCWNSVYGIYLDSSNNNTLINNNCSSNSNYGMWLYKSSNNTIVGNDCSNNAYYGISIDTSNNDTLSSNTCNYNDDAGIQLSSSKNNRLLGNEASNNLHGIYIGQTSGTIVTNNTCSNNSQYGMYINSGPRNVIFHNTVSNNVQFAIYISNVASSNNRVWNNTFYHNRGSGDTYDDMKIQASDSGTNNYWNSSSEYGNYWSDQTGPDTLPPSGIVDFSYNLTGTSSAKDLYPLTDIPFPPFIPEFSEIIIPILGLMLISLAFNRTKRRF